MRKLLLFFGILFFTFTTYGQSSNTTKTSDERVLIPFRPNTIEEFDSFDLKKLIGYWISLDGKSMLKISQSNNEFIVSGDYFPGVSKNGDKATIELRKENDKYVLELLYILSLRGGGGGVAIVYYPEDDHLVVGDPPYYKVDENGEVWVTGLTTSSEGIYGKEFKHMK